MLESEAIAERSSHRREMEEERQRCQKLERDTQDNVHSDLAKEKTIIKLEMDALLRKKEEELSRVKAECMR